MAEDQIVTLQSQDLQEFKIEYKAAKLSETIKNLIEDAGVDHPIPLPNISGKNLQKVVEYMKYHAEHPSTGSDLNSDDRRTDDICPWDLDFATVDQTTLFELILASNYMDVKGMLDLMCKTLANQIKGKTPEELLKQFNITKPFTQEEEDQVRAENEWCEER